MSFKILGGFVLVILLVVAGIFYLASPSNGPGPHDEFAKCINEKGAKFYGAFWCPHCNNQKALFGNSMKYVNYIECSTQDRQQLQVCIDANIQSYPTWEFADGSRLTREVSLADLASKTSCSLA